MDNKVNNKLTPSLLGGGGLNNTIVCLNKIIRTTVKSLRN